MATWTLDTRRLGRTVHVYDSLPSTNSHALALVDSAGEDGLAVLARHQSAGRGQHGRTWTAPSDSSVLLSVLLFPPAHLRRPVLLTAWAAVAVAEFVLEATGEQARIKWPNDVYLQGKKICGILIEQRSQGDRQLATVAGIGLNVAQPAAFFEASQLPLGGSLLSQTGRVIAWEDAARRLIHTLDVEYEHLLLGDEGTLESLWSWRLGLLGKRVVVESAGRELRGRLVELTFSGLVLETNRGAVELMPEAVQHVHAE